jgi:hypothetical protein
MNSRIFFLLVRDIDGIICIDAVAAAMYTIGFAETVRDLLKVHRSRIIL